MKSLKHSTLVLAALIICSNANAEGLLVQSNTINAGTIHTLKINNTGDRWVSIEATARLGTLQNNSCNYTYTYEAGTFTFSPKSETTLTMSGSFLKTLVGLDYSCGDVTMKTDKLTQDDYLVLENNGSVYTSATPPLKEVFVD